MRTFLILLVHFCLLPLVLSQTAEKWRAQAQQELKSSAPVRPNYNEAKNVILFIGDGMGVSTVTAGRIFEGQKHMKFGEEHQLSFDKFPVVGLSKTYSMDGMVPDSAATATAFLCGVKTKSWTVGLGPEVEVNKCSSSGEELQSILKWAMKEGKSGGIVTTTRMTHATPASAYAHSPSRGWEDDSDLPADAKGKCPDIASQLLSNAKDVQVLLGGGRQNFLPKSKGGKRNDSRDIIQEWQDHQNGEKRRYKYVNNVTELNNLDIDNTDYLFGLMADSHLPYDIDIIDKLETGPRLPSMVEKAIKILSRNEKGYFLLVEGGRIDHGHHAAQSRRALQDVVALSDAVEVAVNMTDEKNTLLVVSADHSHVFTMGGYTSRGVNILGVSDGITPTDNKPATTILYGNGPGAVVSGTRENVTESEIINNSTYRYQAAVPLSSETHGGEDVGIYAKGPMAHLFTGVREQNYIAHAMAYASCVGPNKDHCKYGPSQYLPNQNTLSSASFSHYSVLLMTVLVVMFKN